MLLVPQLVRHLAELKMVKKLPMYVPHELTVDQKKTRFDICSQLLLRSKNESFIDRIVTCDEKWCLYDNRKRCDMWLNKNDPRPPNPFQNRIFTQKRPWSLFGAAVKGLFIQFSEIW